MKMIVFVGASAILKGGFNFANSWMGQEWSKLQLCIVGKGYFGVMESWFWCWPFLFASIATAMNIFGKDSLLSYLIWAKDHFLCWQLEICHISWLSLPSPLQWNEANNKMFTIYIYYIHFIVYIASYLSIYLSICLYCTFARQYSPEVILTTEILLLSYISFNYILVVEKKAGTASGLSSLNSNLM